MYLGRGTRASFLWASFLACCLALWGCKKASEEIGSGKASGGRYLNKKLGMGFHYPKSWTLISDELAGINPDKLITQVSLFLAVSGSVSAFQAKDQPMASIAVEATRLRYNLRIKTERDFANLQKKSLRKLIE